MSKQKPKIVDLELSGDGTYGTKDTLNIKKVKPLKGIVARNTTRSMPKGEKPKYVLENNADHFLGGIDVGLDFLDNVIPRVERFLKLRG